MPARTPTSALAGGNSGGTSPAVRTPIRLGVLYAVNDGAEQAGIQNGNSFTVNQVVHAFVDIYNDGGGIGGRRIEPVYAELHSASNNYEGQVARACAAFTEDNHVAAVIMNVGYYSQALLECLGKASVPLISGDWAAPDQQDADRYPLYMTPTGIDGDTRVALLVDRLAASGFLKPASRIGVVIEGCPIDQRVYKNSLVPALRRAGLSATATYEPRCFQSIQDYGGQASDIQGAVLQFNGARVDRVIVVSQAAEANIVNLFTQGADAQRYYPGYALSSIALPAVLALNAPATQLANAKGVGWLPSIDTENLEQAPRNGPAQRCLDQAKRRGMTATSSADFTTVFGACDSFGLLDALLRATNGTSTASALRAALADVGPRFVAASTVDGRVRLSPSGHIGAGAVRLFGWSDRIGFVYTSGPSPVG
jgi:ABC-type branched-subunit amino acid transport system substrate-binding protein